jgi:hypothetical protein
LFVPALGPIVARGRILDRLDYMSNIES